MKNLVYTCIIISFTFLFLKCTEVEDYSDPLDNIPPGSVSNVNVENFHGGATITYTLPADKDLLGVKAVYSLKEGGEFFESFSSAFRDTVEIYGFPDTSERTVQLICIDESKNESVPVEVAIQPLTPPVNLIRETLQAQADFGGIRTEWVNTEKSEVGISLYYENDNGEMVHNYTYFSNGVEGNFTFRGFDDTERKFRIELFDRWNNYADSFEFVAKPMFETKIWGRTDGGRPYLWTRFGYDDRSCEWRGDLSQHNSSRPFSNLHNDMGTSNGHWFHPMSDNELSEYTGREEDKGIYKLPQYLTIDLGSVVHLNRLRHYDRQGVGRHGWRKYEIWAKLDTPKGGPDDFDNKIESIAHWTSWEEIGGTDAWKNDWVQIADITNVPPSGATTDAELTDEDFAWSQNGWEHEMFRSTINQEFRYVRIVIKERWFPGPGVSTVGNLEFWGAYVE